MLDCCPFSLVGRTASSNRGSFRNGNGEKSGDARPGTRWSRFDRCLRYYARRAGTKKVSVWRGCRREPASDERVSVSLSVWLSAEDTDASGCAPRSLSCYLVDPASSHMLVSKIKPCMSKFTLSNGETANGSLNQSRFLRWSKVTWITVVILERIHGERVRMS